MSSSENKIDASHQQSSVLVSATQQSNDNDATMHDVWTVNDLLERLRSGMDRAPLRVIAAQRYNYGAFQQRTLIDWSVLLAPIMSLDKEEQEKQQQQQQQKNTHETNWKKHMLNEALQGDLIADRALGCMMGMVAGDAMGAPLEFIPARSNYESSQRGRRTLPHVKLNDTKRGDPAALVYVNEHNAFELERGQWTDDASMGLCLAESMLVQGGYHGGDVRIRFYLWWFFSYCNAFRHDEDKRRTSVGLGGNISKSIKELLFCHANKDTDQVPPRFESYGVEDSGNGSLMRLAPVPIRFHGNPTLAMETAAESSFTTHPGPDAANCCRFLAYFCCRAMHHPREDKGVLTFIETIIGDFLALQDQEKTNNASMKKLKALLTAVPPSEKEACWNWKAPRLAIEETLVNRGSRYNGYPVASDYFGSYCMDGLAMALWAFSHSTDVMDCLIRVVNLGGDADTTGSIAGQMAGAFYGYQASFENDPVGRRHLSDIRRWDPIYEIELRALLLYHDGKRDL